MSERNGDKARFQKNRKRKLLRRQRLRALAAGLRTSTEGGASGQVHRPATTNAGPRSSSGAKGEADGRSHTRD
jgi:hypothetical protein